MAAFVAVLKLEPFDFESAEVVEKDDTLGGGPVVNQTFRLQIKTHLEGHKSLCRLNWVSCHDFFFCSTFVPVAIRIEESTFVHIWVQLGVFMVD